MRSNRLLSLLLLAAVIIPAGCSQDDVVPAGQPQGENPKNQTLGEFTPSTLNDSLALVALYDALGGQNWKFTNWKRTPIRYWDGVKVENLDGQQRVTAVELYGSRVKGELPKEIGMLTEVKRLVITYSDFLTGSIIDEVYNLKKLQVLNMSFTGLTGELSPLIGQLTELDTLILWKSQFGPEKEPVEGEKPTVNWEKNTVLFSGSLPHEIGKLTKLRELNLARCGFEGQLPEELGDLASIGRLDLSESRYTGTIPASLGNLKKLEWLALCKNQLTGCIPPEISQAKNIKTLVLANNQLTGSIPSEIGQMERLGYFDVEFNRLSGSIPVAIENNTHLGIFYANDNQLSGTIPSELGRRHPYLVRVTLDNNQLTGSLPDIVGNDNGSGIWTCVFSAKNNRLTGDVPALWVRFPDDARKHLLPQQAGFGFENLK